jgi:hypothetical protein
MVTNNSTNRFSTTPYIVSAIASQGSYTTIQSAINAASAAGGGVVYVKTGTYFENLVFANNISLVSDSTGVNEVGVGTYNATIFGSHTFLSGAFAVSFRNIVFGNAGSGTSPLFSIANSSGQATLNFESCIINDVLGAGAPTSSFLCAPTATGNVLLQLSNCRCVAGAINASLGANSVLQAVNCSFENQGGTESCVLLNSATSRLTSSYNTYNGSTFACIRFTANGVMQSLFDAFTSSDPSTYYIKSSGAFGILNYGDSIAYGSATSIDPQITKTLYSQNPDVYPTTNGQVVIGRTGNTPVAATLTGGAGIAITNGSGSITIASNAGGFGLTWQVVNTSFTMTSGNGYIIVSGPGSTYTLPSTSAVGDVIALVGNDVATTFTIAQAAGKQIRFGNRLTTLGAGGSIVSADDGAAIFLLCTVANTSWSVIDSIGNFTIV